MRKYIVCLVALLFSLSMFGCGGGGGGSTESDPAVATSSLKLPEKLEVVTNENQ